MNGHRKSRKLGLLVHLSQMTYQLASGVEWAYLGDGDVTVATQAEEFLRLAADALRQSLHSSVTAADGAIGGEDVV